MKNIVLLSAILFLSACASQPQFDVYVDSLVAYPMKDGAKVYIESKNGDSGLEKKYYEDWVKEGFKLVGYDVVLSPSDSDYMVFYRYSTTGSTEVRSKPIYQYKAPQSYSYNTYGTNGYAQGNIQEQGIGHLDVVGSEQYTVDVYSQEISFSCVDTKKSIEILFGRGDGAIAWEMKLKSKIRQPDMKATFPIVLAAGMRHFRAPRFGVVKETIVIPKAENEPKADARKPAQIP